MSKEFTVSYLTPGIPEPYAGYIKRRNAEVGKCLATLTGSRFLGSVIEGSEVDSKGIYYVPAKPILKEKAKVLGVKSTEDLFGGVVEHSVHADKAILHLTPTLTSSAPEGYLRSFALSVRDAVLPGYSAFTDEDALHAFQLLNAAGEVVLVKDPSQSDADGQVKVKSQGELMGLLRAIPVDVLSQKGMVLEAFVQDPVTQSVGQVYIDGKVYCYFGQQTSVFHEGRNKYGGTRVEMYRGEIENLPKFAPNESLRIAVAQSIKVRDAFSIYDPVISRMNFDIVQGINAKGEFVSGVTDQSFRLGGASPAEVLAIEELEENPAHKSAIAEVLLGYDPLERPDLKEVKVFLDEPTLLISARLLR